MLSAKEVLGWSASRVEEYSTFLGVAMDFDEHICNMDDDPFFPGECFLNSNILSI